MSVYTQLTLQDVQTFAWPYGLQITALQPIQGGIENTNYFLQAQDQSQYVLTVFEEIDFAAATELPPVLQHLAEHAVPVAAPLQHDGCAIHMLAGKPAQIAPKISGSYPIPTSLEQVQAIATAQAKMHLTLQNYPLQRENNHGQAWWQHTAASLQTEMSIADRALLEQVFARFKQSQLQHPHRPQGLIHADLFRDNTLFVGDELQGILDFSELSNDELLLDIAITLNDFCSAWPAVELDESKQLAYLDAYGQVRPLTADELACLNSYLAMAACRFWLSRLQVAQRNLKEGRTGEDILQKDPEEMRAMLVARLALMGS